MLDRDVFLSRLAYQALPICELKLLAGPCFHIEMILYAVLPVD